MLPQVRAEACCLFGTNPKLSAVKLLMIHAATAVQKATNQRIP